MTNYPKDKCPFCHHELTARCKELERADCENPECIYSYSFYKGDIAFKVTYREGLVYHVWVNYDTKKTYSIIQRGYRTTRSDGSHGWDYQNIFNQKEVVELDLQGWKDLIDRIEKLQAFK